MYEMLDKVNTVKVETVGHAAAVCDPESRIHSYESPRI